MAFGALETLLSVLSQYFRMHSYTNGFFHPRSPTLIMTSYATYMTFCWAVIFFQIPVPGPTNCADFYVRLQTLSNIIVSYYVGFASVCDFVGVSQSVLLGFKSWFKSFFSISKFSNPFPFSTFHFELTYKQNCEQLFFWSTNSRY
jgi:hypothetical protein